jgi:Ca2+-binding RTX toxin-like protein
MAVLSSFSVPFPGGEVSNVLAPLTLAGLALGMQVPLPEEQPAPTLSFVAPTLTVTLHADASGISFAGGVPFGTVTGASFFAPEALGGFLVLSLTDISVPATAFFGLLRDQDVQGLYDLILGGDDQLLGGAGTDAFVGHGGNDTMDGQGGTDTLDGGAGNDSIAGGNGADVVFAEDGEDTVLGGADGDVVLGGAGADSLAGDEGDDSLSGEAGDDGLDGGAGDDTLSGGSGADLLTGFTGNDLLHGDRAFPASGERGGQDTLFGHDGSDTIFGLGARDYLFGGADGDVLAGGAGGDRLTGGAGADTLAGGGGADRFYFDDLSELNALPDALDVIVDFNPLEGDRIGLRAIDANALRDGNQAFRVVTSLLEIAPGRVLLQELFTEAFAGTVVSVFVDGDAIPDGQFLVANMGGLTADDFIL